RGMFFFVFQAEDGLRDRNVTGVQTCALPISSKAAVKLLTEALYAELLETNVHVTVIFPGAIATGIAANSGVDLGGDATAQTSTRSEERRVGREGTGRRRHGPAKGSGRRRGGQ